MNDDRDLHDPALDALLADAFGGDAAAAARCGDARRRASRRRARRNRARGPHGRPSHGAGGCRSPPPPRLASWPSASLPLAPTLVEQTTAVQSATRRRRAAAPRTVGRRNRSRPLGRDAQCARRWREYAVPAATDRMSRRSRRLTATPRARRSAIAKATATRSARRLPRSDRDAAAAAAPRRNRIVAQNATGAVAAMPAGTRRHPAIRPQQEAAAPAAATQVPQEAAQRAAPGAAAQRRSRAFAEACRALRDEAQARRSRGRATAHRRRMDRADPQAARRDGGVPDAHTRARRLSRRIQRCRRAAAGRFACLGEDRAVKPARRSYREPSTGQPKLRGITDAQQLANRRGQARPRAPSSRASQSDARRSARRRGHARTATRCGCIVSAKCVKPCAMRGKPLHARRVVAARRARDVRAHVVVERKLGQAPQSAPDAERGTPLEQDRRRRARSAARALRAAAAPCADAATAARRCDPSWRAMQSSRTGHTSQRGRVRVQTVAPRSISACVYASMSPHCPAAAHPATRHSAASTFGCAGIAVDAAMAREHALDVAVEDRAALAERERRDRRRRRAADARQRRERRRIARKRAAVIARRPPAPPRADDARAGSSRVRSSARARDRAAPRRARARRETRRRSACSTA